MVFIKSLLKTSGGFSDIKFIAYCTVGITGVQSGQWAQWWSFGSAFCGRWFDLQCTVDEISSRFQNAVFLQKSCLYVYFLFFRRGIILWIKLTWPENLANTCARHKETWTAVSTLLCLISRVYHDLPHWRSNQRPQNAEPKLHHWAHCPHCTPVMPNRLVIAQPITTTSWFGITGVCCGLMDQWLSFDSAFCSWWFDLLWRRSWYPLLMRPNKVEIDIQYFHRTPVSVRRIFWSR